MSSTPIEFGITARTVAANVRRLRKARGLDQDGLSVLMGNIGRPMIKTVVSKTERCDRRIDVDDLVALASVLNVSTDELLFAPGEITGESTGGVMTNAGGATARTVASNVRRLREARGLSLRALSDEIQDRGWNLSADAINKIENGRDPDPDAVAPKQIRRVDVDDLVALAAVFDVPPATLLEAPGSHHARGDGHRGMDLAEELLEAVRDVVDPLPDTDVAARARTARRLMAQLGLELDEVTDVASPT